MLKLPPAHQKMEASDAFHREKLVRVARALTSPSAKAEWHRPEYMERTAAVLAESFPFLPPGMRLGILHAAMAIKASGPIRLHELIESGVLRGKIAAGAWQFTVASLRRCPVSRVGGGGS